MMNTNKPLKKIIASCVLLCTMSMSVNLHAADASNENRHFSMTASSLATVAKVYALNDIPALKKLHDNGNLFATHILAHCYSQDETCAVDADLTLAKKYRSMYDLADMMYVLNSLKLQGNLEASNWVADYLAESNQPDVQKMAFEAYQANAAQGNSYAMFSLGNMYFDGRYPVKKDINKAYEWYEKAAEKKCVKSMYKLASIAATKKQSAATPPPPSAIIVGDPTRELKPKPDATKNVSDIWKGKQKWSGEGKWSGKNLWLTEEQWLAQAEKNENAQQADVKKEIVDAATENDKNTIITTYFGTNRNITNESNPAEKFGDKVANVTYGTIKVNIPKDHRIGEIESPFFRMQLDPNKHVTFPEGALEMMPADNFYQQLSNKISQSDEKSALVFIHGFNTSFENAAKRTAQMSYDLRFDGVPVFYSWPARKTVLPSINNYHINEKNIEQSMPLVTEFLEDVLSKTDADNLYLIAHSMGNRALMQSLVDILDENPQYKNKIKELILAAPDVDAQVFKEQIAPVLNEKLNKPATLYSSNSDLALTLSEQINKAPRLGDSNNNFIYPGIENVDVSNVDSSLIGHSYYGDNSSVISDMMCLIHLGKRANERTYLKEQPLLNGLKWLFNGLKNPENNHTKNFTDICE